MENDARRGGMGDPFLKLGKKKKQNLKKYIFPPWICFFTLVKRRLVTQWS